MEENLMPRHASSQDNIVQANFTFQAQERENDNLLSHLHRDYQCLPHFPALLHPRTRQSKNSRQQNKTITLKKLKTDHEKCHTTSAFLLFLSILLFPCYLSHPPSHFRSKLPIYSDLPITANQIERKRGGWVVASLPAPASRASGAGGRGRLVRDPPWPHSTFTLHTVAFTASPQFNLRYS